MPDSTIQPILCCVGHAVAGRPTQFMMERAFDERGLDWRAITVEVASDRLEDALLGMQVMRFAAIRLFDVVPPSVFEKICSSHSLEHFVGDITSASLRESSSAWEVWHNFGFGLIQLIRRQHELSECVFVLGENSVSARSLLVAAQRSGIGRQVVWCGGPAELPAEFDGTKLETPLESLLADGGLKEAVQSVVSGHAPERLRPILGGSWSGPLDRVREQLDAAYCVVIAEEAGATLPTGPGLEVVRRAEQIVSAEAYDFERWTGSPPDWATLREAYEEYCDF